MTTITHTDYVFQQGTGGALNLVPGVWVRLLNNSTAVNYYSTAVTDATSAFTHSAVPGDYSLYTGSAATVVGTPTLRNAHYSVPVTAGDDAVLGSGTVLASGPYAASAYAVANPGSASIAGPQPWIDVTAPNVTVNSVNYALGALFNGTGDDGVAINNAYTAATNVPNGGAVILMPPGTGRQATQIVPKANATLQGAGDGATTLQWFGATSTPMIQIPVQSGTTQVGKCHFKFFKLDTRNQTGVGGMVLNSWFQSVMEDVWIANPTTAGTVALILSSGATGGACSYNWLRGVRLSSCDFGLRLNGNNTNAAVTNNYYYGLAIDDCITTSFDFVQYCDTNTYYGTRVGARAGSTWTGAIFNSSAFTTREQGVYNIKFYGVAFDNGGGLAGTRAFIFNYCYGISVYGLWTAIGPGGAPGQLFTDNNAQSYYIELLEATALPADQSTQAGSNAVEYVKGYTKARSRQVVAFVTPYTPNPTAGEIIEFGTLTASIGINAPTPQPAQATGQLLTFIFTQNGTGGWSIAWNAIFKTLWQPSPQANAVSAITFYWDGTQYRQLFVNLIDSLGRLNAPAELVTGTFVLAGTSVNAGTAVVAGTRTLTGKTALAYSASITPDASASNWQTITVSNATAFTVNAPTSPPSAAQSEELTIEILNSSGGAMGVITWNAAFLFAGVTWANPANTKKRFVRFEWNGVNWVATAFSTADY